MVSHGASLTNDAIDSGLAGPATEQVGSDKPEAIYASSDKPEAIYVSVEEAESRLSDLIAEALNERMVFIQRGDKKVLLVPVSNIKGRQGGTAKGLIHMSDDFDEPLEDFKEYME